MSAKPVCQQSWLQSTRLHRTRSFFPSGELLIAPIRGGTARLSGPEWRRKRGIVDRPAVVTDINSIWA